MRIHEDRDGAKQKLVYNLCAVKGCPVICITIPVPHASDPTVSARETIVQDILRRVRHVLALTEHQPFRLAGLEMFEWLTDVATCSVS